MKYKTRADIAFATAFLMISFAMMSMAAGAGSITLTPASQGAGGSVSVAGTGFGATKAVGIGFGAEKAGSNANMAFSEVGTDGLTWTGRISNYPIKPGSFIFYSDTGSGGIVSTYTDVGDGTTMWSYDGTIKGTINYVTGVWTRTTTVDVTGIAANYSATYICYDSNVTAVGGVTTSASGSFTTNINVPSVAVGTYSVTAIDTSGNRAASTLSVSTPIPETLTIGIVVVLSTFIMFVSFRFFREQPKIRKYS